MTANWAIYAIIFFLVEIYAIIKFLLSYILVSNFLLTKQMHCKNYRIVSPASSFHRFLNLHNTINYVIKPSNISWPLAVKMSQVIKLIKSMDPKTVVQFLNAPTMEMNAFFSVETSTKFIILMRSHDDAPVESKIPYWITEFDKYWNN